MKNTKHTTHALTGFCASKPVFNVADSACLDDLIDELTGTLGAANELFYLSVIYEDGDDGSKATESQFLTGHLIRTAKTLAQAIAHKVMSSRSDVADAPTEEEAK